VKELSGPAEVIYKRQKTEGGSQKC